MAKQISCQKFVYKLRSSRLRKASWNLSLSMSEARKNDEVVALADSQVLRWIDEINGRDDFSSQVKDLRHKINMLRKEPTSPQTKKHMRELYGQLDLLQFQPDYLLLIIDRNSDYWRACKGFRINDISYRRLLGTTGGIKNSTIVFVNDKIYPDLSRRIENGRDLSKPAVPAKLEAYKSLTCSASTPVSMPNGVLVVNDCETSFLHDIIYLSDENEGEPLIEVRYEQEILLNASDGCGLMLPALSERWSEELSLGYVSCGMNTRFAFEKGMVFTFDFIDFAQRIAHENYFVEDAWGDIVDIRTVELVLTTSMVKLWDSYASCEEYINCSIENGYSFSVTKTCPSELENERTTNYQFLQSYELSDSDITELISPTVDMFWDVLGGDPAKTVLFLAGSGLNDKTAWAVEDGIAKAIMIDERMANDPYVRKTVFQLIKNRINEAKVGKLNVHGNYSIVCGDPYALCQSIFKLPVTGLLRSGEIYNQYWQDAESDSVVCFRAPMTCHNNICKLSIHDGDAANYWYRYITTATIFNSWDCSCSALNGMDFDGDMVMLTDNPVLLRNYRETLPIFCAQRKADKIIPSEKDFIQANINSFGNDIGKITNRTTSMFEIRSGFEKDSAEYATLSYRIQCGQLLQQAAIDKAKGIVSKPMPRAWYDYHTAKKNSNEAQRNFSLSLLANRKPYFMRYIYPSLSKEYNTYRKNSNRNALRLFGRTISELLSFPDEKLSNDERLFLESYHKYIPVGSNACVMNRICKRFEETFDNFITTTIPENTFDASVLSNGVAYSPNDFYLIKSLYKNYNAALASHKALSSKERREHSENEEYFSRLNALFFSECNQICTNQDELYSILLKLCYQNEKSKSFFWKMCASEIIDTLYQNNCGYMSFPVLDDDGDISYGGNKYALRTIRKEVFV